MRPNRRVHGPAGAGRSTRPATSARKRCRGIRTAPSETRWSFSTWASKRGQRDLGTARPATEHALAEEHAPDRHAVDAAHQGVALEHFDRMGVPVAMQVDVRLAHARGDPGAVLARPWRLGACRDHLLERGVRPDLPRAVPEAAAEARRQAHAIGGEHHARIGRPPQRRLAGREPRKDAVTIGIQQARQRQVAPDREQAVGLLHGAVRRREGRVGIGGKDERPLAHRVILGSGRALRHSPAV
mgnify:CR=1 FL=1